MTTTDSEPVNWILGPVGWAINYVFEEHLIASTLHRGVSMLTGLETVLALLEYFVERSGEAPPDQLQNIRLLREKSLEVEPLAIGIEGHDFSAVNRHAVVGLSTALDGAFQGSVTEVATRESGMLARLRLLLGELPSRSRGAGDVSPRKVFKSLFGGLRSEGVGVGRAYQAILGAIDIELEISSEVDDGLTRLRKIRNSIVHPRNSQNLRTSLFVAEDEREMPVAEPLVTVDEYSGFYDVCAETLNALLDAIRVSPYISGRTA